MRKVLLVLCLCLVVPVGARELKHVDFPETMDLGGQKLILNGVGLRVKRKMMMNFDVYVAGLYVVTKGDDAKVIMEKRQPKVLDIVFLRSIDKKTLRKSWDEAYTANCKEACAETKPNLRMFTDLMDDVKDKDHLKLRFDEDGVNVEISGNKAHSGHISSEAFRKNLLAVFIGDHPPTAELKDGLLGKE